MPFQLNVRWVYILAGTYILLASLFIYMQQYLFLLLPLALLVLFMALFAMDKLLYVIILITPLSVPLRELTEGAPFDMYLPTEPILVGISLLFFFKLLLGNTIDRKLLLHPVSLAIYFYMSWMLLTSLTSTMPVVSIKDWLAHLWFIVVFYFLMSQLFRRKQFIQRFYWLYIVGMAFAIGYTLYQQYLYGLFDHKVANWAPKPFFNDHTAYGAALAFYFPFLAGMLFNHKYSPLQKGFTIGFLIIFTLAIVFSYTRATWLSLAGAAGVLVLLLLKLRLRYITIAGAIIITLLALNWKDLMLQLEHNTQDSSGEFAGHVQSMTNITTDASNLERINRWKSAWRMFKEKPVLGWGPGAYMFQYAPFQMSYEKTIISTNFGNRGNAHSEYLGPLAESGVLGPISFLAIVMVVTSLALRLYRTATNREIKLIVLVSFLGLSTYFLHGFLNNFLSSDKASLSFWGFIALLVALDVYYPQAFKGKNEASSR